MNPTQIILMKNNNIILSKEGSERHIRDDLWPQILSRLPVKSLLRFRCVSKSWLSMINDPDFCRLHLENFKNNRDETHLLVVEGRKANCVLRCSDTFKPFAGPLYTLVERWENWWRIEFSIDGLVLLQNYRELSNLGKLGVWNPSICKFHDIPPFPETEASANSSFLDEVIGFGYDPLAKDYKVVKLIFVNRIIVHSVAVYTLGARSWKTIPFQGKGFSNWPSMEISQMRRVYLRGSVYFTAFEAEGGVGELISIDLSTELFSCTKLPSSVVIGDHYLFWLLTLVDDRSTLALFNFVQGMWVLESSSVEGDHACWIQRYSFSLVVPRFLYHKKNGDVLIWSEENMSFTLPTFKELSQPFSMVSRYNPETEEEEFLLLQKGRKDAEIYAVWGYVESLNLLV